MNSEITAAQAHHRKEPTKRMRKPNKDPVKVVYISSPMKFKTSASKFRALVQKLTGQDAEFPDAAAEYNTSGDDLAANQTAQDEASRNIVVDNDDDDDHEEVEEDPPVKPNHQHYKVEDVPIVPSDDDVFTPQMEENYSGWLFPSNLYSESPLHVDMLIKSLDAV